MLLTSPSLGNEVPSLAEMFDPNCGHFSSGICDSCNAELNARLDEVDAARNDDEPEVASDEDRCHAAAIQEALTHAIDCLNNSVNGLDALGMTPAADELDALADEIFHVKKSA